MPGIEIDDAKLEAWAAAAAAYNGEFAAFPLNPVADPHQYAVLNGSFMAVDGNLYYGAIRALAPKRIVEIGSGNSTLLAVEAVKRNAAEGRQASQITCVEPYRHERLRGLPFVQVLRKKVQGMPVDFFQGLESGDILFIDSSHALRSGGDVWWEYCEILPRLPAGVLVHVHDISLPRPYPRVYFEQKLFWTEQYLLQAFLCFNRRFEVLWAGNYFETRHPGRLQELFPVFADMRRSFPQSEPSSFWMRSLAERT